MLLLSARVLTLMYFYNRPSPYRLCRARVLVWVQSKEHRYAALDRARLSRTHRDSCGAPSTSDIRCWKAVFGSALI